MRENAVGMTEFIDIYPTLCDLAGLEGPQVLEGQSLVPLLKDPWKTSGKYALSQYPRGDEIMGYSIRSERYRLTVWFKGPYRNKSISASENIEAMEFYDYQEDPLEKVSLVCSPGHQENIEQLKSELLSLLGQ